MTTKPRRGRPPQVVGRKRGSPQLKASVTDDEHARVAAHVAREQTTVSDLIRLRLADVIGR